MYGSVLSGGLAGMVIYVFFSEKDIAFLYFEKETEIPPVSDLIPESNYFLLWFDPVSGEGLNEKRSLNTDNDSEMSLSSFPDGKRILIKDWTLKIKNVAIDRDSSLLFTRKKISNKKTESCF